MGLSTVAQLVHTNPYTGDSILVELLALPTHN